MSEEPDCTELLDELRQCNGEGPKAFCALSYLQQIGGDLGDRFAVEDAAERYGCRPTAIKAAYKLNLCAMPEGAELVARVQAGEMTLKSAEQKLRRLSGDVDQKLAFIGQHDPAAYSAWSNGDLTLGQAYAAACRSEAAAKRARRERRSEAIETLITISGMTERRLRSFNLQLQKLSDAELAEAVALIDGIEAEVRTTKTALTRLAEIRATEGEG